MPTVIQITAVNRAILGVAIASTLAMGTVRRVPQEYATIQSALDVCEMYDSVQVAPGSYHEFLESPAVPFTLIGEYEPGENPALWSLLDPIPLPDADTPSCLAITADTAFVKNIAFFNRLEYRETEWASRTGGVRSNGELLVLENCRFDSVSEATRGGNRVHLINCTFVGCTWWCVDPNNNGTVIAESCDFDGRGEWLVRGYTGSRIENCEFVCYSNVTDLLSLSGSDMVVSGCRFGPSSGWYPVVRLNTLGNCVIEECLFDSIETRESLIDVSMACPGPAGIPVTIRNNVFQNYRTLGQSVGTIAISLLCQGEHPGYFGVVENNTFVNGRAGGAHAPGLVIRGSVELRENELTNLEPQNLPDMWADARSQDSVVARQNTLQPPGLAMSTEGTFMDARWNWWGDSSGPHNSASNPNGQGSDVGNNIQFDPWLFQHPDSLSDTSSVDEFLPNAIPSAFSLSAYPNPFNAITTLVVDVPRAGEYSVTLYDITGREVRSLFNGQLSGRTEVRLSGENLPSGLYFARMYSDSRQFATTKLLLLR